MATVLAVAEIRRKSIPLLLLLLTTTLAEELHEASPPIFADFGILHTLGDLSHWAQLEERLFHSFEERVAQIKQEITLITRYLEDYEESSGKALDNLKVPAETAEERGRVIGSSAVLGHLMTDRYVTTVREYRNLLSSNKYQQVEEKMSTILEVDEMSNFLELERWPKSDDLTISHYSILKIQEMYNVNPTQMYKGLTVDTSFGGELRASHCATFGQFALRYRMYYRAIEWLQFALSLLEENDQDDSISADIVKSMLHIAIQTHNRMYAIKVKPDGNAQHTVEFYVYPISEDNVHLPEKTTMRSYYYGQLGAKYGNGSISDLNELALCSGWEFQTEEIRSRLTCFLDRKKHPYFILNPLKTEMLSEHPFVVQLYDVLGNDTIREMYETRGLVKMSTVYGGSNDSFVLGTRTSAGTLLSEEFEKIIRAKSEMLTGLKLSGQIDTLQNVEYVYGRLYHAHKDPLYSPRHVNKDKTVPIAGDRVATLLYYIDASPNLIGGVTPFCEVGIAAQPIRGSAVFWINMFRNGTIRSDVNHAACPPIHGHKIVLNQWIRYNHNFQTFKCSLSQFD